MSTRLALVLLLLAPPPASAKSAPDPLNLAVQHAATLASLAALSASLEEMGALGCVLPDAKERLGRLQGTVNKAQAYFGKVYKIYVTGVTKPMQGNGKCDGGFQAVAAESEQRRQMTEEFETVVQDMQRKLARAMNDDLLDVDIDMPDESDSQDCADKGEELHDAARAAGLAANAAITRFRAGTVLTERKFGAYTAKNTGLGDDCGSLTAGMATLVQAAAGAPIQPPQGRSVNPGSTITGEIGDEKLAEIQLMRGIKARKPGDDSAGASDITGTAASAGGDASRRQLLDFGNPFQLTTRPVSGEEAGVKELLAGKDGGNSRAGAPLSGMIAEMQRGDLQTKQEGKLQEKQKNPSIQGAGASVAPDLIAEDIGRDPASASTPGASALMGSSSPPSSTVQSSTAQFAPAHLGSPDESLFRRMSMTLRQGKRELERRGR